MPTKDIAWVAWIHRGYGQFTIQIESDLKAGEKLACSVAAPTALAHKKLPYRPAHRFRRKLE